MSLATSERYVGPGHHLVDAGGFSYELPDWVEEIRPHQIDAVDDILESFSRGAKIVFLDAPTGAGKTLIGEMVRQRLHEKTVYACSGLELQTQFSTDFPRGAVIRGRSNYPVLDSRFRHRTAADCMGRPCSYCDPMGKCPYRVASRRAVMSDLAVVNTTYFLYSRNMIPNLYAEQPRPTFVVADECDTLEGELLSFLELRVKFTEFARYDLEAPKSGSHYTTLAKFLRDEYLPQLEGALDRLYVPDATDPDDGWQCEEDAHEYKRLTRSITSVEMVVDDIAGGNWVRDDERDAFLMKPITVATYGTRFLWRHASKWLCMSATVISAQQRAQDLGIEDGDWEVVTVPMTFPIENRKVILAPVTDTSNNMDEDDERKLLDALELVREKHRGERMLVHAHSYKLTKQILEGLEARGQRDVFGYLNSRDRRGAIDAYLRTPGAMIVAPSLDRGVDFKGDACRVIALVKVPYPYLGDKQVSARMRVDRGWYACQTVQTIVQMTGRGVRSKDDYATTYVLDSNFGRIYRMDRQLFPRWWQEAVDKTFDYRKWLTR